MFDFNLVWNFRISFVFRFYHSITYHCYYYSFQGFLNCLFIIYSLRVIKWLKPLNSAQYTF